MPGTYAGGKAAEATNKKLYGADFYSRIGAKGGKLGHNGGFASYKVGPDGLDGYQRASKVGRIGGLKSRKTKGV